MKKHFFRERFLPFLASLFLLIFLGCGGGGGTDSTTSNSTTTTTTTTTSTIGVNWTQRYSNTTQYLESVAWNGSKYVIVGSGNGLTLTSSDGITWTSSYTGIDGSKVIWGNNKFVAVGSGEVWTSTDGATWTRQISLSYDYSLYSIAWNGTKFVAVGSAYSNGASQGLYATSTDGVTWSQGTSSNLVTSTGGIAWNGSQFVAVGNGISTSPDGTTWTQINTSYYSLASVAWNGSKYVAVGYNYIISSTDGMNWAQVSSPGGADIVWTGTQFIVVGYNSNSIYGTIYTSPDGTTWTSQTSGVEHSLLGITGNSLLAIAVGESGTIVTSSN